jgi:ribonucleoside-diphosphate reductase alpha chain
MNAGAELQQLSACFVDSPADDMADIFQTAKEAALVMQSGGGMGYSFTDLRPKGDVVSSTGGIASGPVSFMKLMDTTCGTIKQGGTRRGAQMAMLRADHPDIGRFCVAKRREGAFANFNISVLVTDEFVEAWENDESYTLYNPRTDEPFEVSQQTVEFYSTEYEDADPAVVEENFWRDFEASITGISNWKGHTDLVVGEPMELPAGFIWDILIDGAWRNGEPGLAHIDRINREHSFDVDQHPKYRINSTNPCGEQPLCEYEACTLGHINLSTLVRDDAPLFDEFSAESDLDFESRIGAYLGAAVDLDRLDMLAKWGTRFLDNVNTQSAFPIDEISERVFELRKIGVGIMGFAQLLIQLGVEYGSEESQEIARQLMARIDYGSKRASHRLAEERGSFDAWDDSKYADPTEYPEWFEQHVGLDPDEWADGYPIRNHNTTTIAPTGTTSIIANTSGGCEPIYRVAYFKNAADDIGQMVEFDDLFVRTLEENGYDVPSMKEGAEALMNSNQFTVERLAGPEMASMFKTADRITPEEHIAVQAAFQEHVDSSISKSVNLPNEATHDDVRETYELALSENLKATAIYRDGSREDQVQTDRADNKLDEECPDCGETLIQAEGCEKCPDESCGFGKCDA